MKDEWNHPIGHPVPVFTGPGEPNHKNYMIFSPCVRGTGGRKHVRTLLGFTKPYVPLPDPDGPIPPGGNTASLRKVS